MPAVGKVLIVGGGIAGMTLAFGFKRAGVEVEIVEFNPQWTVLGVGISLGGPGVARAEDDRPARSCVESVSATRSSEPATRMETSPHGQMPRLNGPDYPSAMGVMRQALHDLLKRERCGRRCRAAWHHCILA